LPIQSLDGLTIEVPEMLPQASWVDWRRFQDQN
jgi:hypothetical protein